MKHQTITGDCLKIISGLKAVQCVISDPPYSEPELINNSIALCRQRCDGPTFVFMYAEDIFDLKIKPDQILFWTKPISTKNTSKRYSRFVEIIACYDLDKSPFLQNTHWSTRSGIFTDTLIESQLHPFQKPTSLIEKILAVNARPGDTVLEPFGGSEPVRKACERMGMNSISIEISRKETTSK